MLKGFIDKIRAGLNKAVFKSKTETHRVAWSTVCFIVLSLYQPAYAGIAGQSFTAYVSLIPEIDQSIMGDYAHHLNKEGRRFTWFDKTPDTSVEAIIEEMKSSGYTGVVIIGGPIDEGLCRIPNKGDAFLDKETPWVSFIPYDQPSKIKSYFERLLYQLVRSPDIEKDNLLFIEEINFSRTTLGKSSKNYSRLRLNENEHPYLLAIDKSAHYEMERLHSHETVGDWYLTGLYLYHKSILIRIENDIKSITHDTNQSHFKFSAKIGTVLTIAIPAMLYSRSIAARLGNQGSWLGYGAGHLDRDNIFRPVDRLDWIVYGVMFLGAASSSIYATLLYFFPENQVLQTLYAQYYQKYYSNRWCMPVLYGDGSLPTSIIGN